MSYAIDNNKVHNFDINAEISKIYCKNCHKFSDYFFDIKNGYRLKNPVSINII